MKNQALTLSMNTWPPLSGCLLTEKRLSIWPSRGRPFLYEPRLTTARRARSSHWLPWEKEKAPGPCELRALLRDEPSKSMHEAWPNAHHMASPDLAIRQRQLCSGARPSAQPKSLARRDRNRFRSLQGRVTSATPMPKRPWTSCWLDDQSTWRLRKHDAHGQAAKVLHCRCATSRVCTTKWGMQAEKHGISGCFRSWHRAGVIEAEAGERICFR